MNATLKTVLLTILKPALYALVPVLVDFAVRMVQHFMTFQPNGPIEVPVWAFILAGCAGLVKLLIRLKSWNPDKVGR